MPALPQLVPDGLRPAAAEPPPHAETILHSHERCMALGLSRIERPDLAPLIRSDLALARERNLRLHLHAAPVMEMLLEQIMASQSMVVLTDAQGTVLHSVGDDGFLERASKVALAPGANWAEASKGTNAIGTALIDEQPTLVHAGEHYMHANGFLTCSAAPIFDPRGNILGVLDVSGDHQSYHLHTMGLVKMSARMIENHWLCDDLRHAMRLHFHSRPEFIGTLMEGIVAVGRDGKLLGANRSALDQLGLSGAALRMHSLVSLFGLNLGVVVDHFRAPMAPPLPLQLPRGERLHVRAVVHWPVWHSLGQIAAGADEPPGQAQRHGPDGNAHGAVTLIDAAVERPGLFAAAAGHLAPPVTASSGEPPAGLSFLQTGDAQMDAVVGKVRRVLDRDIAVLVLGETGTGKELLARAIHHDSARARYPFVAVNCASIPESLIESELFGYEEGAFTGARRKGAVGKIVQAHGGTLFLDEIGDMPLALQARLLRVLQERQVTPLGSARSQPVDVAVVSATHRDLRAMIAAGTFREDLYYRLNGLVVKLPALRDRSDLQSLVSRILRVQTQGRPPALEAEVLQLLHAYRWPGNIRQLANVLRTAAVMAGEHEAIGRAHLSDDFLEEAEAALLGARCAPREIGQTWTAGQSTHARMADAVLQGATVEPLPSCGTLDEQQLQAIRLAIDEAGGNISVAARRLGISRNTIYRKLRAAGTPPGA